LKRVLKKIFLIGISSFFAIFRIYWHESIRKRARALKRKPWGNDALAEILSLPQDACMGETILTFLGRNLVRIENYRSILIFSDTGIKIQAKRYRLSLSGKNLTIRYYDKDEMEIAGRIEAVTFEQGGAGT